MRQGSHIPSPTSIRLILALFLAILSLGMPLHANLPIDCPACSGTNECDCDPDDSDDNASVDGDEPSAPPRSISAGFGSLRFSVAFGRASNEPVRLGGQFSVYAITASPLVYTTQYLQYRNRLLDRILQTEVAPAHCERILGTEWEERLNTLSVFGRVVTDSSLGVNVTHQVRLLGTKREAIIFQFTQNNPVGHPIGDKATLHLALRMRDQSGNDTSTVPFYYDLCFGDGSFVRYAASDGRVVSCTTASGRAVTPEDAGLEAVWDDSGLVRQVRSESDGLADVVATSPGVAYEIRLYAPSQINGKTDGLYTVTGPPHTVWRVSNPNAGTATHVHVTRIADGIEETTVYEYSHNSDGWMKTSPDNTTIISSTSTMDLSRTLKSVVVTERTRAGTAASRTINQVRNFPFGERIVSSTLDPDGARLRTSWEYYFDTHDGGSYGRRKSENRPDGGWTTWRYDGHGRVSAVITPWKNSAFNSPDNEAKAVLYSYSPVDARDTVTDTDTRPRVEETKVLGITTSKAYHAHYTENGCRVEVQERCVHPDAAYGASNNLRTVKRWYPAGAAISSASAGRLHTVLGEGGLLTTYAYERGTWTPGIDDATHGTFIPGSGSALKITVTHGTPMHPVGIAFRTLREISVRDGTGNEVFTERQVYTGSDYARLDWSSNTYDFSNHLIRKFQSNTELTETTWNCCAKASETLPDGRTYLHEYDAQKRLVARTLVGSGAQPDYVTEYTYDAAGNVTTTTTSGGGLSLTSTSTYDLARRLLASTDARGMATLHAYLPGVNTGNQRRGETVTLTHPGGAQTITAAYCDGRVKSVTGNAQVAEYYEYGVNADGTLWTLVRLSDADSPRWAKTTTDLLGRTVKTEKPGYGVNSVIVQHNTYDAAGRLVRTTQTGLADTLYEYDELGELIRTGQDADGNGTLDLASNDRITDNTTAYMQDNNDDWWLRSEQKLYATVNDSTPTMVSASERRVSGFANGVVSETRSTDIHGNTVVTATAVNRAAKTVTVESLSPESTVAEQRVTVNGLVVSIRSRSNLTTTFGYDGLRRRVSVTAPRTGTSTIMYNHAGQISAETDAAGSTTSYGYDNAGRLAWKRDALNKYARYAYNSRGQQVRVWGDTEYPVEYGYDQYGQKVTMSTFRTGTSWNGESWPNPAPQGDTTTWNYDEATGLLLSKVYADGNGPSYTYTADGKLASRTWARKDGQGDDLVTTYTYNLFGELTGVGYSDSTPGVTYAYNRAGKLAQVTDVVGTRTFAYNATMDEVSETVTGLYGKTLARAYTSTGFKGRRQGLSVDNVLHYTYGYDAYGRMDRITIPSGSFAYTRLANSGLVSQMTRPNGIATAWSYEPHRDLVTQVQNGTVSTYGYVNDAIGRRTSMSRSGGAHPNPDTISYAYNDRSELTGAQSDVDTACSYSYTYDHIGNRITASEGGVPWAYTTNRLNQYTSATEDSVHLPFSYDLDGSMTYRPVDATGGWTQTWNCENRMVETFKGNDRLTFKYDYMGRRVEKCVYSGDILTSKTLYVYDGFKCVEELDGLAGNAVLRRHAWQPFDVGLDVILATTDATGASYFLHDANKNVMQKTDANGALLEKYEYTPFGGNAGETSANIGFSSERYDEQHNSHYYNFRYYYSIIGRWSKRDPLSDTMTKTRYSFVLNDAPNKFDMLGLTCCKYLCPDVCLLGQTRDLERKAYVAIGPEPQHSSVDSNELDMFINIIDITFSFGTAYDLGTSSPTIGIGYIQGKMTLAILNSLEKIQRSRLNNQGHTILLMHFYQECENESCLLLCNRNNWSKKKFKIIKTIRVGPDKI